jgi:hypothetical protein
MDTDSSCLSVSCVALLEGSAAGANSMMERQCVAAKKLRLFEKRVSGSRRPRSEAGLVCVSWKAMQALLQCFGGKPRDPRQAASLYPRRQ